MRSINILSLIFAELTLSACGTYVPELQEFPGSNIDRQQFVSSIVTNVNCEVRDAIDFLYRKAGDGSGFLDKWGVQTTLMLAVDEKTEANPGVNWIPHGTFNLSGSLNASAHATREDSINSFYLVKSIVGHPCSPAARSDGPFMMQSDLKLRQILFDAYTADATKTAEFNIKNDVITHHVKFEINTGGNITPTYKITRVEVNPSGDFLSLSRNRVQDLIVTLGPVDDDTIAALKKEGRGEVPVTMIAGPSARAELQHLSFTIGAAVAQSIRTER